MALPNIAQKERPCPAGYDFAGTVVDANGSKFNVDDEVFGWSWSGKSLSLLIFSSINRLKSLSPKVQWQNTSKSKLPSSSFVQRIYLPSRQPACPSLARLL